MQGPLRRGRPGGDTRDDGVISKAKFGNGIVNVVKYAYTSSVKAELSDR